MPAIGREEYATRLRGDERTPRSDSRYTDRVPVPGFEDYAQAIVRNGRVVALSLREGPEVGRIFERTTIPAWRRAVERLSTLPRSLVAIFDAFELLATQIETPPTTPTTPAAPEPPKGH